MAARAYILVETAVGMTRSVAAALSGLDGMLAVDVVTGPYDIIALFEGPNLTSVGDVVTRQVHTIEGINRTITCLAIELS